MLVGGIVLPFGFPFRKKPWEKVACTFVVQESLLTGAGYDIITEASGSIPTKAEAAEFFKPGRYYRVMARAVEENKRAHIKAGTLVGVVWKHYEPLPGGVVVKEKLKQKIERERKPADPSAIIDEWAEGFKKQLEPIKTFAEAIGDLRESLAGIVGAPAGGEGPAAAGPEYTIEALQYEGKAPWMLHPQVVKTVADELKNLIEYGADRLEGIMGEKGPAPETEEVEEEEVMLPSLITEEAPAEELVEEVPAEEVVEEEVEVPAKEILMEEEEVEPVISGAFKVLPEKEKVAEVPLEEVEDSVVPSLLEKDLPCAQCGRTDVPLLPSGLCEKCVKDISEIAPEGEKENE